MRIAITAGKAFTFSETFIRESVSRLPGEPVFFYGGALPTERANYGRFYPSRHWAQRAFSAIQQKVFRLKEEQLHQRAVVEQLRRCSIDVVLAHYTQTAVAMLEPCHKVNIPLVVHCHGMDVHQNSVIESLGSAFRDLSRYAHAIIAVSQPMKRKLVELGVAEGKIIVQPCSVDLEMFLPIHAAKNPPLFLSVGRFVDKKAPFLTLLAFQKVHQALPETRLEMIGDGPLFAATRTLADVLGLREAVAFPGVLPHSAIAQRLKKARAYVQHSARVQYGHAAGDSEGTPVAILEAAAMGLPVISTNHAGIPEAVIHETTGLLAEEQDIESMACNMRRIALDPQLAETLGQAGRKHMENHYSMKDYIATLERVLREAVVPIRNS